MQAKKINKRKKSPTVDDLTGSFGVWSSLRGDWRALGEEGGGGEKQSVAHPIALKVTATSLHFLFLDSQPRGVTLCCRLVLMQLNYSHFLFFNPAPTSSSTPVTLCSRSLHIPSTLHSLFF